MAAHGKHGEHSEQPQRPGTDAVGFAERDAVARRAYELFQKEGVRWGTTSMIGCALNTN